jgi:hypothetical protein
VCAPGLGGDNARLALLGGVSRRDGYRQVGDGKDACGDMHITSEGRDKQIGIGYSPIPHNITRAIDDRGQICP